MARPKREQKCAILAEGPRGAGRRDERHESPSLHGRERCRGRFGRSAMTADPATPIERGPLAFASRLQRAGRYAEGEAAFAEHLLAHPNDPEALAAAGAAALEAGHPPLAVNRFEKLAALQPANASARSALGQALTRAGAKGSPWYPSLWIFRQHRFLDWSVALDYAEAALRRFAAEAHSA